MRTVRRLLYRDIVASVTFVALAFLSLLFFFDFVRALEGIGRRGFSVGDAVSSSLLEAPGNLYDILPIAVLIGSIFTLARMSQTSEFTILRTGGLGPGRALKLLAVLGLVFALLTLVVGDVVAPLSAKLSAALRAEASGGRDLGRVGAWLRDERPSAEGPRQVSVNVARVGARGELVGIRLFEFDKNGQLRTRVSATSGSIDDQGHWQLKDAVVTQWPAAEPSPTARVSDLRHATLAWPTQLDIGVVSAAVQPVATMTTWDLWRYASHLADREQAAQRHSIQFWKKAFYPFACLVMVALALPFAYLSSRAGGTSLKVFGGIMLGITFVLLNSVTEHLGVLSDWTPWLVAAAPSLLFLALSLGAFAWLVRYR